MAEATQTITFKLTTELTDEEEAAGETLSMELDEEMNAGNTTFTFVTGTCYIKIFSSVPYAVSQSHGDTAKINANVFADVTETITFSGKNSGSVSNPITSITSSSFDGLGSLGSLSIGDDNKTLTNSAGELLGTLTITYKTAFDRWTLSNVAKPAGYDDTEDPGLNVIVLARSEAAGGAV